MIAIAGSAPTAAPAMRPFTAGLLVSSTGVFEVSFGADGTESDGADTLGSDSLGSEI